MEINYPISGLVVLAAICLIIFLIRRNRKDQKKFEKEMTESEIAPEKQEENQV